MTAATQAAPATSVAGARSAYSTVAIALHWLIAALMIGNIGLAWYFTHLPKLSQFGPAGIHKSIGLTVLLLTLVRIAWRLANKPPPLPDRMATWERWTARGTHVLFYLLMLGLPLSGWAMVSASPLYARHPATLWGLPWPRFPLGALGVGGDRLDTARHVFTFTHEKLAWLAYVTITLHVAAALKHHLIDRDDVLTRMLPLLPGRRTAP